MLRSAREINILQGLMTVDDAQCHAMSDHFETFNQVVAGSNPARPTKKPSNSADLHYPFLSVTGCVRQVVQIPSWYEGGFH